MRPLHGQHGEPGGWDGQQRPAAQRHPGAPLTWRGLPLLLYVVLKGLHSTALKGLQEYGAAHPIDGENPISFCNVFFVAQLIVGLAALLPGRAGIGAALAALSTGERRLLTIDALLGMLLGPIALYTALERLSVISQTLLFALVLPLSALLARRVLGEALPRGFWISLLLISAGLLLPQWGGEGMAGGMDSLVGVGWALVGVCAFAGAAVSGRAVASRGWPAALSVGVPSCASALVFGVLALVLYGPGHFHLLRLWWVVGVILIYGLTLSLGSELALRRAYRNWRVAVVSLVGSLTIVVAVLSAWLVLGEPLGWATVAGLAVLLAGTALLLQERPPPLTPPV